MSSAEKSPPAATRRPSVRDLHGERVTDDYAWMRDPRDPDLRAYLAAERDHYEERMAPLRRLVDELAAETAGRYPSSDEDSVAWQRDGFTYRTRLPEGRDNEQLLRSGPGQDEAERVLLDENVLAARSGYIDVGVREPSPDGSLLAWSADTSGAEIYKLRIRDLTTGEDLADVIPRTYPGLAWAADRRHLFYLVPDALNRPWQVWRHEVGTSAGADVMVLQEPDERFELTLHRSRSGKLAVITSSSRDTMEVHLIALDSPLDDPVLLEPRRRAIEYRIDSSREAIYVVTNDGEREFTLKRAPLEAPGRAGWEQVRCDAVAPARADTRLLRCDVLAEHLLLTLRRDGAPLLAIADHDGGNLRELRPQPAAGAIAVEHAEDYDSRSVIVREESLVEPPSWWLLDLRDASRHLLKRLEVPGYDPARYVTVRLSAPAADGTSIPVTLAHRADTPLDGSAPCLLYGYGSYEASIDPEFERSLPSLLDRGVVYAIAHIRGGGENGRRWWQQGRLRAKATTFTDYIAVADWLAGGGEDPPRVDGERIVTRGASAGGLLQGAVYSMRPDRWRAVVAEVPFVDVVNTMLDPSIPLTITEWDEWGDPRDPGDYACMRGYSPYENPPEGARPSLLVTGAVHDPRVGIHEPAKWVARLRATDGDSPLLFRPELGVGAHSGPSGRSGRIRYEAEVQAFILEAMGLRAAA